MAAYEARGAQRQYTHDAGMDALSSGLSHNEHCSISELDSTLYTLFTHNETFCVH